METSNMENMNNKSKTETLIRTQEYMRFWKILHKYAMKTKTIEQLNIIEDIQKEISKLYNI